MAINQVEKTDYTAQKISYTSKDYTNILEELIESIPSISTKWQTTDENDPRNGFSKINVYIRRYVIL